MKKKRKRRTGIQLVIFSLVAAVSILTVILVMGKLTRKKVNIDNSVILTQKDTPTDMTEIKDTHEGIEEYLAGPNVYVFAKDATDGSLKVLTKFAKKNEEFVIKGGIIDGKVSTKEYVETIAALPSKEGLVSMLLSVLQAPMRNLAYSLSQVAEKK